MLGTTTGAHPIATVLFWCLIACMGALALFGLGGLILASLRDHWASVSAGERAAEVRRKLIDSL